MNIKDNEFRKVINHASTRWLSLGNIDAMDSLKSYFLLNFDLDHDPTENNPDEKISREKRLVNAFKQSVSKQYAIFVQSLIPASDIFNTFLQAKLRNH